MFSAPQVAQPILDQFAPVFRPRTLARMQWMVLGAILLRGRRTFTRILILLASLVQGHYSTFYRLFSRPRWSCWKAGRILAHLIIEAVPLCEAIVVLTDTTVSEHPGRKVYGKGKHRDAVRSSHSFTAWLWGHKRVVVAIAVTIPFVNRRWALPVMVALYRPESVNQQEGRRHKTPAQLARGLMRVLMGWFPEKQFIFVGDGEFSSHETARFARKHRRQLTYVGRFYADANLYEPPPAYSGKGRPRVRGEKQPAPQDVVAQGDAPYHTSVAWYGGEVRQVALRGQVGHWYKGGHGLVTLRWVYVEDRDGTHRPEYFFSTDPNMNLKTIVEYYTLRWNIETTFQEVRAHLGFASTRHRSAPAVRRVEAWLLILHSIISLIYIRHLKDHKPQLPCLPWYAKQQPTFADAITQVRRLIWLESIFTTPLFSKGIQKLTTRTTNLLIDHLTQAA